MNGQADRTSRTVIQLVIEGPLGTGESLQVAVGIADQMGCEAPARIDTARLDTKAYARQAQHVDGLTLARPQPALDPDEAAVGGEVAQQAVAIQMGQYGTQLGSGLGRIPDLAGIGEDGVKIEVAGEDLAIAVDDFPRRTGAWPRARAPLLQTRR